MGFTAPDVYSHGRHWRTLIATPFWDSFGPAEAGFSAKFVQWGGLWRSELTPPSFLIPDEVFDDALAYFAEDAAVLFTEHVDLTTEEEVPAENN